MVRWDLAAEIQRAAVQLPRQRPERHLVYLCIYKHCTLCNMAFGIITVCVWH